MNMKKTIIFLLIGIKLCMLSANAQQISTYVYTCKSGPIAAVITNHELNATDLAIIDYELFHPYGMYYDLGITRDDIIAPPSGHYNCHAYAWHLTEGNSNEVCIYNAVEDNYAYCYQSTHNIDAYWEGVYACFVECSETYADKIHYTCEDHSAVKSSVPGKYESKWGVAYLLRHHPDSVPYKNSGIRNYYQRCSYGFSIHSPVTTDTKVASCENDNLDVQNVIVTNGATLTLVSAGDINVQAVSVINNSKLILDAGGEVNIISDFEVELGSEFEIK